MAKVLQTKTEIGMVGDDDQAEQLAASLARELGGVVLTGAEALLFA